MAIPQHLVVISEFVIGTTEVTQARTSGSSGRTRAGSRSKTIPSRGLPGSRRASIATPEHGGRVFSRLRDHRRRGNLGPERGRLAASDRRRMGIRVPARGRGFDVAVDLQLRVEVRGESREKDRKKWIMTTPVRSFEANKLGIYDIHGNVEEWCWDRFASYSGGTTETDPLGIERRPLSRRAGRGMVSSAADCRTSLAVPSILRRPRNFRGL